MYHVSNGAVAANMILWRNVLCVLLYFYSLMNTRNGSSLEATVLGVAFSLRTKKKCRFAVVKRVRVLDKRDGRTGRLLMDGI